MQVFITGASGFIGSAVVPELLEGGHQVLALARSDTSARALEAAGASVLRGHLEDVATLHEGAAASDGVIHLAYNHDFSQYAEAARTEHTAIETFGMVLKDTGGPLVVASGVLGLAPGRIVTEQDLPGAGSAAATSPRVQNMLAALALAEQGVRSSVVRLAPSVHDEGRNKPGFVGRLVAIAQETGMAGYLGNGASRWSAVHRLDAARLFRLALESAPSGSVLHGVAEEGVSQRAIAELIGERLGTPVREIPADQAEAHFGWLAAFVGIDSPASSTRTQALLGWEPTHPTLLGDLRDGAYFTEAHP